jgi:Na+/H+-dicarboxylate symporter
MTTPASASLPAPRKPFYTHLYVQVIIGVVLGIVVGGIWPEPAKRSSRSAMVSSSSSK